MKQLTKQQLIAAALGSVLTIGLGAGAITFAQTTTGSSTRSSAASSVMMMRQRGVDGTVTAVNDNTIDASSAKITKDETK